MKTTTAFEMQDMTSEATKRANKIAELNAMTGEQLQAEFDRLEKARTGEIGEYTKISGGKEFTIKSGDQSFVLSKDVVDKKIIAEKFAKLEAMTGEQLQAEFDRLKGMKDTQIFAEGYTKTPFDGGFVFRTDPKKAGGFALNQAKINEKLAAEKAASPEKTAASAASPEKTAASAAEPSSDKKEGAPDKQKKPSFLKRTLKFLLLGAGLLAAGALAAPAFGLVVFGSAMGINLFVMAALVSVTAFGAYKYGKSRANKKAEAQGLKTSQTESKDQTKDKSQGKEKEKTTDVNKTQDKEKPKTKTIDKIKGFVKSATAGTKRFYNDKLAPAAKQFYNKVLTPAGKGITAVAKFGARLVKPLVSPKTVQDKNSINLDSNKTQNPTLSPQEIKSRNDNRMPFGTNLGQKAAELKAENEKNQAQPEKLNMPGEGQLKDIVSGIKSAHKGDGAISYTAAENNRLQNNSQQIR